MTPVVDINAALLRIETKTNIIAKAVIWILAAVFWTATYFAARSYEQIPHAWDFFIACAAAFAAAWLTVERPIKKLEERIPLFSDD